MEILLENVRSFCGEHKIPLRPLTFLVGENSTGKTSFLAMLAQVHQGFPSTRPDFNAPPFDLGTYDSIATYKGGRYGRADYFCIGFNDNGRIGGRKVTATYRSYRGQPQLTDVSASGEIGRLSISLDPESHGAKIKISSKNVEGGKEVNIDLPRGFSIDEDLPAEIIFRTAFFNLSSKEGKSAMLGASPPGIMELSRLLRGTQTSVFALAPVRTKPRRTYDQYSDEFDPEGDHVPVVLARLGQDESDSEGSQLDEALSEFGKMSGLYDGLKVRHLGNRPTDPFQLLVSMGGPPANLSDVGYGVSQTLPIIVQSILAAKRTILLLQQPEVHLHPRAQAALGSFFARLVAKEKKELVIETHSDYLLDRVRVEIARGTLKASDVLILFFEKEHIETQVHPIEIDDQGNVSGAPESYRRFFFQEEAALLSRAKS